MRNVRAVALVLLAGLLAAACGARLPSTERRQAAAAVLNAGSGGAADTGNGVPGTGPFTGNSGPAVGQPGEPGTGRTGSGQNGSGQTGTGQTGTGQTGNGSPAGGSTCATGGTDVGLTSNSVKIGTIASTTGPVSGLFEGAFQGIKAFAAYANSLAGICRHGVQVDASDYGTNCGRNQNST